MITTGSYKGNPTITLASESKWPFTFGVAKAKLVLANIEAIKAFVAKYDRPAPGNGPRDPGEDAQDRFVDRMERGLL
jgi:hypothetical protein